MRGTIEVKFLLGCSCSGKKREIIQKTNDNLAVIPPGAQAGMARNELPVSAVNKLRDVVSVSRMFVSESAQINRQYTVSFRQGDYFLRRIVMVSHYISLMYYSIYMV